MNPAIPAILTAAATIVTPQSARTDAPPIRMDIEQVGDMIRLAVIGDSTVPVEARYTLDVSSDVETGGNHSVQSGTARLDAGRSVTLISLAVGNARPGNWLAALDVHTADGASYRVEKHGAP